VISINVFFNVYNTTKDKKTNFNVLPSNQVKTIWPVIPAPCRISQVNVAAKGVAVSSPTPTPYKKNQRLIFNLFVTENVPFIVFIY
jgi:hypothetical protein